MSLWNWTLAAYARPGAQAACLELQDGHGHNVCFLLWAAWARVVDPVDLGRAAAVARAWDEAVTGPLRQVRRALKTQATTIDGVACDGLRQDVIAAELRAERALLEALESLTVGRGGAAVDEALAAACAAWGGKVSEEALNQLAGALDLGLLPARENSHDGDEHQGSPDGMDDDDAEWERGLRARLALLTQEHADMDAAIQALSMSPLPDIQIVGRLKRRKLALKDEIARIQDQLTPDIIA